MSREATHNAPSVAPGGSARRRLLRMENVGKSFSGARVLEDVSFDLFGGEVHVLAGENGAGKSTLIKILGGVHTDYEGGIHLGDERVTFRSPHDAASRGISVIHQEMSLIGSMSVVDNIFLGREKTRGGVWMAHRSQREEARSLLDQLGIDVDLTAPVGEYPVSVRQMIEIAKALASSAAGGARIIVMDEPTSALSDPEVDRLFGIVGELKRRGCGIVYISHRMEEIYRLADRITVLRDGRRVGTAAAEDLSRAELVRWMVGREIREQFPPRPSPPGGEGAPAGRVDPLRVEGLFVRGRSGHASASTGLPRKRAKRWAVEDVSFALRAREILGVAGLRGSGKSELLAGLFGAFGRGGVRGRVYLDGKPTPVRSPRRSIADGLALLTNDRKGSGLVAGMNVARNLTLASIRSFSPGGWLRPAEEEAAARRQVEGLSIRLSSPTQEVSDLSGGNQQKVVLGKWLETRPKVLLLDEPTRGVDVGAKHDIYELMNRWTSQGVAILLVTSEMPELLAMSDRILVMHRGRAVAELSREEATQERVLRAAMGEN